ncbi:MAG: NAD(P)-dependent oxidoreductase, partial [Actinomycetota bacterium]|nr:NAD(P)-dependent oxidoreductase [Actinomycetota bacterium]
MRVLVTGGAGFIGSHIAEALADHGHEPVLVDNLLPKAHGEAPAYPGVVGDVRDPA